LVVAGAGLNVLVVCVVVRTLAVRVRRVVAVSAVERLDGEGTRSSRASSVATGSATVSRAIRWAAVPRPPAKTKPRTARSAIRTLPA